MPSTLSPDKLYELMSQGENNGSWGTKTNANLSIIDLNFGGRLPIDVSGNADITVSDSQARNVYHTITGALTGSINYKLPNVGSFYFLSNGTTGAFNLTAIAAGGTGIVIPQGTVVMVFVNPDTSALSAASSYIPALTGLFLGGTTGGSANAQTVTVTTPGFSLTTNYTIICKAGFSNTNTTTLAVNGGTAKNIYKQTSSGAVAVASGDIQSGTTLVLTYDGTEWQLISPSGSYLTRTNNLSDLPSASTARTNLGLGTAATHAATDFLLVASNLTDVNSASTSFDNIKQSATTSYVGATQYATGAQVATGTSTTLVPTVGVMTNHKGMAKAWINFNGSTGAILDSYNVTSLTKNSTGNYTVNLSITMLNALYSVQVNVANTTNDRVITGYDTQATGSFVVKTGLAGSSYSANDFTSISATIHGQI